MAEQVISRRREAIAQALATLLPPQLMQRALAVEGLGQLDGVVLVDRRYLALPQREVILDLLTGESCEEIPVPAAEVIIYDLEELAYRLEQFDKRQREGQDEREQHDSSDRAAEERGATVDER